MILRLRYEGQDPAEKLCHPVRLFLDITGKLFHFRLRQFPGSDSLGGIGYDRKGISQLMGDTAGDLVEHRYSLYACLLLLHGDGLGMDPAPRDYHRDPRSEHLDFLYLFLPPCSRHTRLSEEEYAREPVFFQERGQ